MPVVSIVLPTFNRTGYLRLAVDSVFRQTFSDWELIVADDGSEHETRAYLRGIEDARFRPLWLAHSGNPSSVRNAAIAVARGYYLAFLDSDDVWSPQKLERQIGALRRQPSSRWSYTGCDRIQVNGQPYVDEALARHVWPEGWILEPMLHNPRNQMPMASIVAARDLVDEVGGFDPDQPWCEDLDLLLRLAMRSPVTVVAEPLCSIRSHQDDADHHSGDRIAECAHRVKLYRKMARRVPDPRLRALCQRKRAYQSLAMARFQAEKGQHPAVWRTLGTASTFSWPYPGWWLGSLKTVVKPFLPRRAIAAYRRVRG
jgi:glycosyltransferase involved in cell wall biosynthesis